MVSYSETIGKRIQILRKKANLSQELLAQKSNLTTSFIGEIERGNKNPSLKSLEKLSEALKIELPELLSYNRMDLTNTKKFYCDRIVGMLKVLPEEDCITICEIIEHILILKDDKL